MFLVYLVHDGRVFVVALELPFALLLYTSKWLSFSMFDLRAFVFCFHFVKPTFWLGFGVISCLPLNAYLCMSLTSCVVCRCLQFATVSYVFMLTILSFLFLLGGMVVHDEESALDLSLDLSSTDIASQHLKSDSRFANNDIAYLSDGAHVSTSFPMCGQPHAPMDANVNTPMYEGFSREQWVELDVVLLNYSGVHVVNGILRNFAPHECLDADPLREDDVGIFILKSLMSLKMPLT